jgi:hypothetical protein
MAGKFHERVEIEIRLEEARRRFVNRAHKLVFCDFWMHLGNPYRFQSLEALAKIVTERPDKDLSANREMFPVKVKASDDYKQLLKDYIDYEINAASMPPRGARGSTQTRTAHVSPSLTSVRTEAGSWRRGKCPPIALLLSPCYTRATACWGGLPPVLVHAPEESPPWITCSHTSKR